MKNLETKFIRPSKAILFLLVLFGFCMLPARVSFAEDDLFKVSNISVDVTSTTSSLARETAMIEVRERALNRVFKRIIMPEHLDKVPELSARQIFEMVKEVEVLEERTSAVRYIARLTITFDDQQIKNILSEAGIPFVLEISKPVLVLPVFRFSGRNIMLWEENNPWRKEWNNSTPKNVIVPFVLPYGELSDISAINVRQAEAVDENAISSIASNYNTETVYIVHAVFYEGLESKLEVKITGYNVRLKQRIFFEPVVLFRDVSETLPELLKKAVLSVSQAIENKWKEERAVLFSDDSSMIVVAETGSIAELNRIINILENIPLVQKLSVQATTKDKAQFKLSFAGNSFGIVNSLNSKGYDADFNRGYWVLKKQAN